MKILEQFVLTFLLNAAWQVGLIVTFAFACDWLLRGVAAHYRHFLWVVTLLAALLLPVLSSVKFVRETLRTETSAAENLNRPIVTSRILTPGVEVDLQREPAKALSVESPSSSSSILVNRKLALALTLLYGLFLCWRLVSLMRAWRRTRTIVKTSFTCDFSAEFQATLESCEAILRPGRFRILCSAEVPVPITIGVFRRLIILPQRFVREANTDVLRSAIGHELVHVGRRDYLTNLIYEFIYVPLGFHPGAAFARRRIKHTRELCCDETVAARLIKPEVYARSLISLIGSAPIWRPLAPDTTIGINESDILEVRIMSLLKTKNFSPRRRTLLLIAAAFLLAIPCVAAARFSMNFDAAMQEPMKTAEPLQMKQTFERETQEQQMVELLQQARALKERMEQAPERERTELKVKLSEVQRNIEAHKMLLQQYGQSKERTALAVNEEDRTREEMLKRELLELVDQKNRRARLIYHIEPAYPADAREKKIEGAVMLGFTVNHQGTPEGIQVKRSLYPSLDQAAVEAVSKWRFEPAMKNGEPASMWMEAEVNFRLNQEQGLRGEAITRDGRTESQGQEYKVRLSSEGERRAEREREERNQLVLAREAKISMDQAIQIATSKVPGKVTECSLVGERWSGPGELAKPSLVLYHVVIISGDEVNPATTHVLVNAADGSIFRTDKEERKREEAEGATYPRTEEKALNGGVLNGKASSLPAPEYPLIARQAHAEGQVNVEVLIDEGGNVIAARSVSGHPLLQSAAVTAARRATFTPTRLAGEGVKVRGILTYNFVAQ